MTSAGRSRSVQTYVRVDCILEKLMIPGMRHHDRYAFALERGYRVRPEEVEIDQRPEEVFARGIPVKKQGIPSGFIHQTEKLLMALHIQHHGDNMIQRVCVLCSSSKHHADHRFPLPLVAQRNLRATLPAARLSS